MLRGGRQLAIKLRLQGKSYSEIKQQIKVSKSSLSLWLKNYPLTSEQIDRLENRNKNRRIERFINTRKTNRQNRLNILYEALKKDILPLSEKEIFIAGLFLYLGEGGKTKRVIVSNTDPNIVKFVLYWYTKLLKIPKHSIKIGLQLYSDMNKEKEMSYWSNLLGIPLNQFWKPYIKESKTTAINHMNSYKHGTCGISYDNIRLHEKILTSIKVALDEVNQELDGRVVQW